MRLSTPHVDSAVRSDHHPYVPLSEDTPSHHRHTFNYTFNWPIKFLSCTSHTSRLRFHTKNELNEYRHNWQHYTAAGLWGCMFVCDSLVALEDPVELIWRQAPDRTATGPSPRASQNTENLRIWSPPHPSPQHHASRCSPAFPEQTQERKKYVSVNYIIKIKMQSLLWLQVKNKKNKMTDSGLQHIKMIEIVQMWISQEFALTEWFFLP